MLLRRLIARLLSRRPAPTGSRSPRSVRGAVMVEYAFLLVAVGIPAVAGLTAGGKTMYDGYKIGRNSMLSPFP
jgi:hypothetical protein